MERLTETLQPWMSELGPKLAARAFELGLAVTRPDGTRVPIAVTLSPIVLPEAALHERHRVARQLASADVKMANAVLDGPDRELLLAALSPLERQLTEAVHRRLDTLAVTRTDFFVEKERAWALELNTTIPAMQGYSDIAARAFIETLAETARLTASQVQALEVANGSNVGALHQALRQSHAALGSGRPLERMAILARRNDAQISELEYCAARFRTLGTPTDIIYPDEWSSEATPTARGQRYDLIYRHLFARRLEESPAPDVVRMLERAPRLGTAVLVNPPSAVGEVKATFALLSEALVRGELAAQAGLTPEELEAINTSVPWTRVLRAGPSIDPDGKLVPNLVDRVAAEPKRFVLKRSWDYGGRAVFIGASAGEKSFRERSVAAFGTALEWSELCRRAARDTVGGGFVVQERIAIRPERHWLCTREGTQEAMLYVDYSAYASVGLDPEPAWGGVCRGSSSQVVNIVGGGGVLPLITPAVADRLVSALARISPTARNGG